MGVFLRHSGIGAVMETVDIDGDGGEAQAVLYESRGWKRVPATVVAAEAVVGRPVSSLDKLSDTELSDVAVRNFITVPPDATTADLVAALEAELGPSQAAELLEDAEPVKFDLADLDALTKEELLAKADEFEIEGLSMANTKAEMIDAFAEHPAFSASTEET